MTSVESPVREFIQLIRECKSKAEERKKVAEASAIIRTALKEGSQFRFRNMVKLIYISMLGYPTQWAQMECLSLIHLSLYADKRAGYLALSLLLDENAEVLLLATNSIINDLEDARSPVIQLALNALGNIASETQCRAAAPVIEKLLFHKKPGVRKKAILVATRIVRKLPELCDEFFPFVKKLLTSQGQDNGVVICIVELMSEVCKANPDYIPKFRKFLPKLIGALKKLTRARGADEYDVFNVRDPFLQVALLKILRLLGKGHAQACELMSDVLAAVITNTDTARNVGNAILFECVYTIVDFGDLADPELRTMAVNILGKFLTAADTNVRYVALDLFSILVVTDPTSIQRYRSQIVECLQDFDTGVRRKALILLYALVDESNVRVLVRELLKALSSADKDVKLELTQKLCYVIEKYAPSPTWYVDSLIKVLELEAEDFPVAVLDTMLSTISVTPEIHSHAVQKLWLSLQTLPWNQHLVQSSLWVIGELGDVLVSSSLDGADTGRVTPAQTVEVLEAIAESIHTTEITRQYLLNAAIKLQERFAKLDANAVESLKKLVQQYQSSESIEIQTRSLEYTAIGALSPMDRSLILARLQLSPSLSALNKDRLELSDNSESPATPSLPAPAATSSQPSLLGDLLGSPTAPPAPTNGNAVSSLLGDSPPSLLGSLTDTSPVTTPSPSLLGDLSFSSVSPTPANVDALSSLMSDDPALPPGVNVFANSVISVSMTFSKPAPEKPHFALINSTFTNTSQATLTDLQFQTAPPKYLKFQVSHLSSTSLSPGQSSTAMIKSANYNYGEKPLMMKMRLSFKQNGQDVVVEEVIRNTPPGF